MKIRAAVAVLAVVVVAALSASCSVAGSASPSMTLSSAIPTPDTSTNARSATSPRSAPITVLPPSDTTTTPSDTSTTEPTETWTDTSIAPTAVTPAEPTVVETTVSATTRTLAVVPSETVVVIDPGHNGGNASHPAIINKQVPAGFGQFKACNTTGTATNAGYAEHAFNWQVATRLRDILQDNGVIVRMTRDSDDGVGPCVNQRAAIGNEAQAAAVISIHGDGEAANVNGFFVMTASRPPAGAAIAATTDELAVDIRDGMLASGLKVSNALGKDGLWARGDLGGLNLSLRPTVMIECGNMRNAAEAAAMSSAAGQQKYAQAIATGLLSYLSG